MLTIICGEDTVQSRAHFIKLQQEYKAKGYYVEKINPNQIEEIAFSKGNDGMLFNDQKMYTVQNLSSFTARKRSKEFEGVMKSVIDSPLIELLDWEEKSAREIKIKAPKIIEFKPPETIFQLQESCYPGNQKQFIFFLRTLAETQEEGFIFTMLTRHIRTVFLAKTKQLPSTVPFWMKQKFESQANKWSNNSLSGFYEGLAKIDVSLKTSNNIYGIKGSIELLSCYYLV